MPTDDIAIPVTVTIIIMGLYIVGGAVLFSEWEGWDMVTSIYFTWVTFCFNNWYLSIHNIISDNFNHYWIWRLQSW